RTRFANYGHGLPIADIEAQPVDRPYGFPIRIEIGPKMPDREKRLASKHATAPAIGGDAAPNRDAGTPNPNPAPSASRAHAFSTTMEALPSSATDDTPTPNSAANGNAVDVAARCRFAAAPSAVSYGLTATQAIPAASASATALRA